MNAEDYIRIILKRRWIIIQVFLIVLLVVIIGTFIQTPVYQASTRLLIKQPKMQISIVSAYQVDWNTRQSVLRSYSTLKEVIEELKLKDKNGAPLDPGQLGRRIRFSVENNILSIIVESENPVEASKVANSLANKFKKIELELSHSELISGRKFIERQLKIIRRQMAQYEGPVRKSIIAEPYIYNYQTLKSIYLMYVQKLQEIRLGEATFVESVQVIQKAHTPRKPIKPKKEQNILFGGLFGLVLGFGIAFFLEYFDDSVSGIEDIKKILDVPVLGIIPKV